jgi:hypothetical protein
MEISKKEKNISITIFILIILYFIFLFNKAVQNESKLSTPNLYNSTEGIITEVFYGYRIAPKFYYTFNIDEGVYSGNISVPKKLRNSSKSDLLEYVGKKYQVNYLKDNPRINEMIFE